MRIALLALLVVGMTHDTADACSCGQLGFSVPARDAVDVPTNVPEIIVTDVYSAQFTIELRSGGGATPLGSPVPLDGYGGFAYRVPVISALAPSTAYLLVVREYGQNRQLISFTTGQGPDTTAPGAVTARELRLGYAEYVPDLSSSCGNQQTFVRGTPVGYEPGAPLSVRVVGNGVDETRVVPATDFGFAFLGTGTCNVQLALEPCKDYSLSLWQRDLAGNTGPVTTYDAHVQGCPQLTLISNEACAGYDGPDVCPPYTEPSAPDAGVDAGDPVDAPEREDGGCTTGGASPLAVLGLLALRRRSRVASGTRSPRPSRRDRARRCGAGSDRSGR